jgi:AcrR family transcriptional regulator
MSSSVAQKRPYRMSARAAAAAATRGRLLAAAWQAFAEHPYEEVRLCDIATTAAVSAQTLHTHFGSKNQLFIAAYVWWGEQEIARRDAVGVGRVDEAIEVLFDHYEAHGTAILRMLSQEERFPSVRQLTDAGRSYHRDWVARIFAPLLEGSRGAVRVRRLTAMVIATDLLVWKLLRRDMQVNRRQAERIVGEMVLKPGSG